ncbi:MAG: hypothetical protein HY319_03360 [Armatimonadetes bacterium]|nr:hypothetical protein [Armatimonadota bacterium]
MLRSLVFLWWILALFGFTGSPAAADSDWLAALTGADTVVGAASLVGRAEQASQRAPLQGLIQDLERLRYLAFKRFVPWHVKNPDAVRTFLQRVMKKYYPVRQSEVDEAMLFHLAFTDRDFEIRPFLEELYTEQIAGLYDTETGEFFVVHKEKGLLERAVAGGKEEQAMINIHELDHALSDQHFNLKKLEEEALKSGSTDRQMALGALLEGDATLVMMDYPLRHSGLDSDANAVAMSELGDFMAAVPWFPGAGQYTSAPLYFKRALIFPYYVGMDFVREIRRFGGWTMVNHMYGEVPVSTEQIYHPEKYYEDRDMPVEVSTRALPEAIDGWTKVGDDTGGEFLVRVFLEQHGARRVEAAAAGWGGDRFRVYRKGEETFLLWILEWDSAREAEEFEREARSAIDGTYSLERQGTRVVLGHGIPPKLIDGLERAARRGGLRPAP